MQRKRTWWHRGEAHLRTQKSVVGISGFGGWYCYSTQIGRNMTWSICKTHNKIVIKLNQQLNWPSYIPNFASKHCCTHCQRSDKFVFPICRTDQIITVNKTRYSWGSYNCQTKIKKWDLFFLPPLPKECGQEKQKKKITKTGPSTIKFPASPPKEWVQKFRVTKVCTCKILLCPFNFPQLLSLY